MITPTFRTQYGEALIVKSTYQGNNGLAIALVDSMTAEPIATLSVNIPEYVHKLKHNQFFVNLNNEDINSDALKSGFFHSSGNRY